MALTTTQRTWTVQRNGRTYRIEMEDEYFFGRRVVRVNGNVAYSGRTVLSDHSGVYQFDLGGEPAFLRISTNGLRYYYDLVTHLSASAESRNGPPQEELAQQPPTLAGSAVSVLVAIAMAAALVLLVDGRLWREPLVAFAGVPVDAVVTRTSTTTRGAHRIDYRFQVGSKSYGHRGFMSRERYERALSVGFVPIRYLAIAPEVNAFDAEPLDLTFDVLVGLLLTASAGSYLVSAARVLDDYRVWRRLSTTGVDTVGRVTSVRTVRNRFMVVVGCVLEYTYNAAGSGEFRGLSGAFPLDAAMHYPVGSALRIRYDPNRPSDSIMLTLTA